MDNDAVYVSVGQSSGDGGSRIQNLRNTEVMSLKSPRKTQEIQIVKPLEDIIHRNNNVVLAAQSSTIVTKWSKVDCHGCEADILALDLILDPLATSRPRSV